MNHQEKAIRLAKTVAKKKTEWEKREITRVLCQYYIAIIAQGNKATRLCNG